MQGQFQNIWDLQGNDNQEENQAENEIANEVKGPLIRREIPTSYYHKEIPKVVNRL